jgi:hypothetical protein
MDVNHMEEFMASGDKEEGLVEWKFIDALHDEFHFIYLSLLLLKM